MRHIILFFTLSICFHFLCWYSGQYISLWLIQSPIANSKSKPIEFSLEEKATKHNSNQIVRQVDPPKETITNPDKKVKTDFLSEKDHRVNIQSRAKLLGLTKNRFYKGQKKPQQQSQKSHSKDEDSILTNLTQKLGSDSLDKMILQNPQSTLGEHLPDSIKIGDFTSLNTDRYLFYSFYSRIEEAIRSKWEHEVEISINNLDKGRYNSPKNIWSTRLDILLTKEGKYYKAILLKESGIVGLDMAAINAFREANFFPHPPKEMINEEGYIRLQYQFHVYYDPNSPTQQRINL